MHKGKVLNIEKDWENETTYKGFTYEITIDSKEFLDFNITLAV